MLSIANHKLTGVVFRAAQSAGGKIKPPTGIVCHDTAGSMKKFSSVVWFESEACETSAHIVVERDGTITQLVAFDTVAYHAGRSSYKGREGCNSYMLGIEVVNPGMMVKRGEEAHLIYKVNGPDGTIVEKVVERFPLSQCQEVHTKEHGQGWCLPYTPEQIDAVTAICNALARAYPTITDITAHYIISPKRKVDVTPIFPLEQLRQSVFGLPAAAALPPVTPEPVTPTTVAPMGVIKATYESKSVWAILLGALAWVAERAKDAVNEVLEWGAWAMGIVTPVVGEVKTTLTNSEMAFGWLKLNWARYAVYITIGCLAIAVVRHINDKRKLSQTTQP